MTKRMDASVSDASASDASARTLPLPRRSPRRRAIAALAAGAAAVLLLAGCAGSPGTRSDDTPSPAPAAVAGVWGDPAVPGAPSLTLANDGSLTGTDGCNRLMGSWELDDEGAIEFSDFASTMMACEGVDTWLARAAGATVSGTTMTVQGKGGREIGTLERTGDVTANGANAAFVGTWGPDDPAQPHLVITEDGTFTGSDGCNQISGSWEPDGPAIEFDDAVSTLMACPAGDQQLAALDWATVAGDTLTVLDEHGVVVATLTRTA